MGGKPTECSLELLELWALLEAGRTAGMNGPKPIPLQDMAYIFQLYELDIDQQRLLVEWFREADTQVIAKISQYYSKESKGSGKQHQGNR